MSQYWQFPACYSVPNAYPVLNCNNQQCPYTFPIFWVNDQLQVCSHPCLGDVKRRWQQCWYCLLMQIIYPENVLSHTQTTVNHVGWDLESRENVPTPPIPNIAPDFAHLGSDDVFHCTGAKWHHAQAGLVIYGEQPVSLYAKRLCSHIGQWLSYQLAWDGEAQVHFSWRTWHAWLEEHLAVPCSFLHWWLLGMPSNILLFQLMVKWMHPWFICS